jgi:hypothetical protein
VITDHLLSVVTRVVTTITLKEEVYRNIDFNKYKFPRLLDSTNDLLNTKKNPLTKKLIETSFKNLTMLKQVCLDILYKRSRDSLLRPPNTLKQANKLRALNNSF